MQANKCTSVYAVWPHSNLENRSSVPLQLVLIMRFSLIINYYVHCSSAIILIPYLWLYKSRTFLRRVCVCAERAHRNNEPEARN